MDLQPASKTGRNSLCLQLRQHLLADYGLIGRCVGIPTCAKGRSSSTCTRFPAGSMIVGVTNISRFFFVVTDDSLRKNRPASGKSPSNGTLSLVRVEFSEMSPPRTTV